MNIGTIVKLSPGGPSELFKLNKIVGQDEAQEETGEPDGKFQHGITRSISHFFRMRHRYP